MRLLIDHEALARQPCQEVGARAADRFNPEKFFSDPADVAAGRRTSRLLA